MGQSRFWAPGARPYGAGYRAPSTALYNTEKMILTIGRSSRPFLLEAEKRVPDYIQVFANICVEEKKNSPLIDYFGGQVSVYDNERGVYAYDRIYLKATDSVKIKDCYKQKSEIPELIFPVEDILYDHKFDHIKENLILSSENKNYVFPLGCFYKLGCALHQIRQAFVSPFIRDRKIDFQLSHLEDWWDQGMRPPCEVYETHQLFIREQNEAYLPLDSAIKEGGSSLLYRIGVDEQGKEVLKKYSSMDIVSHGRKQVVITYSSHPV